MATLQQAAHRLGVSEWNVKRMIDSTRNCKRPPKGRGERSDWLFSD
jgi:hypothetical protein